VRFRPPQFGKLDVGGTSGQIAQAPATAS